jgi:Ni/Co efflux regulator RcnB
MTRSMKAAILALALSVAAPIVLSSGPAAANNINQPYLVRPDHDHRHGRDWRRDDHRDHRHDRHDRRRDDRHQGRDHDRNDRGNILQQLFP